MKRTGHFNLTSLLILLILPMLITGCGDEEITSHWLKGDIKIDGNQEDWGNTIIFLKDQKVGIGIQNDSTNLYLCLVTSDRGNIMRSVRNGFTLWIDPQNGNRVYGIKFPIGITNDMMFNYDEKQSGSYQDMGSMMKKYESSMNEFELVNQDGELLSGIPVKNDYGIELKINITRDQMVYELKIPLNHSINNGFFVNAASGSAIRLGFEEGKPEKLQMGNSFRGNGGGDGDGGGGYDGGRRGGGSRGGYGGGRMGRGNSSGERSGQSSEPLNFWLKVNLAANSADLK